MATQAGFVAFLRGMAGIQAINLPECNPAVADAYCYAIDIVSLQIRQASRHLYDLAVYNLATDYLINWAPDPVGQTYFSDLRKNYKITAFVAGVISSTSDEGTAESMVVPDSFKNFLIGDLQLLKTPFGQAYLGIAQKVGSLWGVT